MKKKGMAQVQDTAGPSYSMTDAIPDDLLADLTESDREAESIERESISYLQMCWRRLKMCIRDRRNTSCEWNAFI